MKITMKVKNKVSCVEYWLRAFNQQILCLDWYTSGVAFCDSGNIKRMKKLYPKAELHYISYIV